MLPELITVVLTLPATAISPCPARNREGSRRCGEIIPCSDLRQTSNNIIQISDTDNGVSRCFSGEVDPPLDGHKIESGSMVALRCKRGETGLSHLVHLTER